MTQVTFDDVLGLASIGIQLYGWDYSGEIDAHSVAACERGVWSKVFWPVWIEVPPAWHEDVRRALADWSEDGELDRAIADAEERYEHQRTARLLRMTVKELGERVESREARGGDAR